jgi:hypothetical protein
LSSHPLHPHNEKTQHSNRIKVPIPKDGIGNIFETVDGCIVWFGYKAVVMTLVAVGRSVKANGVSQQGRRLR